MLVEPPRPDVRGDARGAAPLGQLIARPLRRALAADPVTIAAVTATTAGAVVARGHLLVHAVLLGVATKDPLRGVGIAAASVAVALRWGTLDAAAVSGAQSVVGAAVAVGPPAAVASSVLAAAALVAAAVRPLAWLPAGLLAALVVAGPSPAGGAVDAGVRLVAAAAATVAAAAAARFVPRRLGRILTAGLGLAAVTVAVLDRAAAP